MQVTITLTDQEKQFLENIQKSINSQSTLQEEQCTLEDVIHQCINAAIILGASMHKGQA